MLILLIYVASLESFGVRYIRPLSPYRSKDIKETVIKGKDLARKKIHFLYTPTKKTISKGEGEQQK